MDTRLNFEFLKGAINWTSLGQIAIFYELKHKWFGWDLRDWVGLASRLSNSPIIEKNFEGY